MTCVGGINHTWVWVSVAHADDKNHSDKPAISFVDFTSFVVMKELRLQEVATADKHFEEVGLRFTKLF